MGEFQMITIEIQQVQWVNPLYKWPFSIATSNYQTLTGVLTYKLGQSPLGNADFSCQNGDLTKNMIVRRISVRSAMFGDVW